jgi:hypothetical protein
MDCNQAFNGSSDARMTLTLTLMIVGARTIKLNDIPVTSVFFFLDPKYDTLEADKMLQGLHKASYGPSPPI